MKEIYVLLAEYNAYVNGVLYELLEKVPPELVTRDSGSYYKSILGLLNHILSSDLNWLNRFRASPQGFRSLNAPGVDLDSAPLQKQPYTKLADWWKRRKQVDELYKSFAAELTDKVLPSELRYTDMRGQQQAFVISEVLLHAFNHQTHHRGQISQILDAAGVQHDYSNILTVLRMRQGKR